jgi:hypothetical protein
MLRRFPQMNAVFSFFAEFEYFLEIPKDDQTKNSGSISSLIIQPNKIILPGTYS